jgi:hypothetical protein
MHFVHGESASDAMACHTAFPAVRGCHRVHVKFCRIVAMTPDTCTRDRLDRLSASVLLRHDRRQQSFGKWRFVGARYVALGAVSPIARKADVRKTKSRSGIHA